MSKIIQNVFAAAVPQAGGNGESPVDSAPDWTP